MAVRQPPPSQPGPARSGQLREAQLLGSQLQGSQLQGRSLPGTALLALAAVAVLVTLLLFAVTPMQGKAGFAVVATIIYIVAQSGVSYRLEGRRRAKDRLATTLVVAALMLAAAPLVIITWYTVGQGVEVWILVLGFQKSGLAGSLALFILMLPVVIRSTEEMLKLVPNDLREASYALGVPKWRTILRVVLPTAVGGIVTGVMLGVARIMGETAPLLLLVGTNQRIQTNPFAGRDSPRAQESLPTFMFEQFQVAAGNTAAPAFQRAWGAALVLIVIIGALNLLARAVAHFARLRS
jgi:phosphate ABC transporter permease subunit PstA